MKYMVIFVSFIPRSKYPPSVLSIQGTPHFTSAVRGFGIQVNSGCVYIIELDDEEPKTGCVDLL
jgi:hypothetical protein